MTRPQALSMVDGIEATIAPTATLPKLPDNTKTLDGLAEEMSQLMCSDKVSISLDDLAEIIRADVPDWRVRTALAKSLARTAGLSEHASEKLLSACDGPLG